MRNTHQAVKCRGIGGKLDALHSRNTKGVLVQCETSDVDVVRDDIALDLARTVCDFELLVRVHKRGGGLGTKEGVIATASSLLRLAVLGAHPEVGRSRIHEDVEVARRRADLNRCNVANIISSVMYVRNENEN